MEKYVELVYSLGGGGGEVVYRLADSDIDLEVARWPVLVAPPILNFLTIFFSFL